MNSATLVGLDVGEKRIGVAIADTGVRIAIALETIHVDGNEIQAITEVALKEGATMLVLGYPRNQAGEATTQTEYVEKFARRLESIELPIAFQDESLTSVMAEQRLKQYGKPYTKEDIDAQAAAIILQDYLEVNYG